MRLVLVAITVTQDNQTRVLRVQLDHTCHTLPLAMWTNALVVRQESFLPLLRTATALIVQQVSTSCHFLQQGALLVLLGNGATSKMHLAHYGEYIDVGVGV